MSFSFCSEKLTNWSRAFLLTWLYFFSSVLHCSSLRNNCRVEEERKNSYSWVLIMYSILIHTSWGHIDHFFATMGNSLEPEVFSLHWYNLCTEFLSECWDPLCSSEQALEGTYINSIHIWRWYDLINLRTGLAQKWHTFLELLNAKFFLLNH